MNRLEHRVQLEFQPSLAVLKMHPYEIDIRVYYSLIHPLLAKILTLFYQLHQRLGELNYRFQSQLVESVGVKTVGESLVLQ